MLFYLLVKKIPTIFSCHFMNSHQVVFNNEVLRISQFLLRCQSYLAGIEANQRLLDCDVANLFHIDILLYFYLAAWMLNIVEVGQVEIRSVLSTKDCICDNQETKKKFVILEWMLEE